LGVKVLKLANNSVLNDRARWKVLLLRNCEDNSSDSSGRPILYIRSSKSTEERRHPQITQISPIRKHYSWFLDLCSLFSAEDSGLRAINGHAKHKQRTKNQVLRTLF